MVAESFAQCNVASASHMPPGVYVLTGRPNPSSADEAARPQTVAVRGGETVEITIRAN